MQGRNSRGGRARDLDRTREFIMLWNQQSRVHRAGKRPAKFKDKPNGTSRGGRALRNPGIQDGQDNNICLLDGGCWLQNKLSTRHWLEVRLGFWPRVCGGCRQRLLGSVIGVTKL